MFSILKLNERLREKFEEGKRNIDVGVNLSSEERKMRNEDEI